MCRSREFFLWVVAGTVGVVLTLYLFAARPASAGGTVTFTDASGAVTSTEPLGQDGRFQYRVQLPQRPAWSLATQSVLVSDDSGQMEELCLDVASDDTGPVTVSVTSEVVVAAVPVVTITGKSFDGAGCTGQPSETVSNPITVTFVPEAPALLGPTLP